MKLKKIIKYVWQLTSNARYCYTPGIHQIFDFSNKKIKKVFFKIVLSIGSITLKSFIRQNRLIDIALEHCFDVTLADVEEMIYDDFIQAELLMALFFQWVKQIWNNFCVFFLKVYTKKTKIWKFYSEIIYFFQLSFFSNHCFV